MIKEKIEMSQEIKDPLKMEPIRSCFLLWKVSVSNIFAREKRIVNLRVILNFEKLNKYIKYEHFKENIIFEVDP